MTEELGILENLPVSKELLLILFIGFCTLILGVVFLLLFNRERSRSRGYEISTRHKLGHEHPEKAAPSKDLPKENYEPVEKKNIEGLGGRPASKNEKGWARRASDWLCPYCDRKFYRAFTSREKPIIVCARCGEKVANPNY